METAIVPERPRKRLGPAAMLLLVLGLLVVLLVALVIVSAVTFWWRGSSRLGDELARIRQAGEPISGEELNEHYRLPPGVEDTTDLWLEATRPLAEDAFGADAAKLPIVGDSEAEIPPPGEPWPDLEAAGQLLEDYRRSLELMHEAAARGGAARYPADCTLGLTAPLDHLSSLRGGARLLTLEAHVRARRGDAHGAAESLHAIFALARSLEREPILVSMLVRLACDFVALEHLERLFWSVDFSDEDLLTLQQDLRSVDYHENLREALLGERAIGMMAAENPGSLGAGVEKGVMGTAWRATQGEGIAFYLEYMSGLIAAAEKPWPQALQDAKRSEDRLMQLGCQSFVTRVRYMIPQLLAPAVSAAFEAVARNAAMTRAADAAIAVERYRRKHGTPPQSLDDLVPDFLPEVPIDPFSGRPLQYVVREDEYLVYSVGRNRTDEGGQPTENWQDADFVFRVGPPRKPEQARSEKSRAEAPD